MNIRPSEFLALDLEAQLDLLVDENIVAMDVPHGRGKNCYWVLADFFVEVHFGQWGIPGGGINAFQDGPRYDRMVEALNTPE